MGATPVVEVEEEEEEEEEEAAPTEAFSAPGP